MKKGLHRIWLESHLREFQQKIMTMIADEQYAHAPDKDRDSEDDYRFHEGMYSGLQMAWDIVESFGKQKDGDGNG